MTVADDTCTFISNAIPNHDFNDAGGFVNGVSEQDQSFTITASPQKNTTTTALSLQYDNAILLNGVKVDLLAAGCFGVGNGKIGCHDMTTPWRYDPMSPNADFGTDSHNAHTQPNGLYHYHGNPKALFDDSDSSVASPVIGFAADGFPIFGSYFDDNGTIRKALSSYQLKNGSRPSDGNNPSGIYDGTFVDDYEYIKTSGDLDECNGMTVNGIYGYYVTESYPHVLGCFKGTPDESFLKGRNLPAQNNTGMAGGRREPNFTAAAKKLGVTEQALMEALGPPPPDLEAAAAKLGITVQELIEILPPPPLPPQR